MDKRKISSRRYSIVLAFILLMSSIQLVTAFDAKTVRGTLYIDDVIASAGIDVKIMIGSDTFTGTTVEYVGRNYIVDIPPGYEGQTGYFYIGDDDWEPTDNKSVYLGTDYMYIIDLHVDTSGQPENHPPYEPSDPYPEDGTTGAGLNVDLSWTGGDPDTGDTVTYDVYFDMVTPPTTMVSNDQTETTYDPGSLAQDTTFYWQIIAWDNHGESTAGDIWSFTTMLGENHPPNRPTLISPTDGQTIGSQTSATLEVLVSDPDGDNMDVTFYDKADDSVIATVAGAMNDTSVSTTWSSLSSGTSYQWYVTVSDSVLDNVSDTWSFTTASGGGGGGDGGGGGGDGGDTNDPPIADASASETSGFVGETLTFNGSRSSDDGTIETYDWDFGDDTTGTGMLTTHTYDDAGTYFVTLVVTDDEGADDDDTITVEILQPNTPPTNPSIEGPDSGSKNTSIDFTVQSTDVDNDSIQYTIEWDDGDETTTMFLPNGTASLQSHQWMTPGKYTITATAFDNQTLSGETTHVIYIDSWSVDDIGYLLDDDGDGTYDRFHSDETGDETPVELTEEATYLLDVDGDESWDYEYDPETGTLNEYSEEEPTPEGQDNTMLILVIFLIIILLIILLIWLTRGKKKETPPSEETSTEENKKQFTVESSESTLPPPQKQTKTTPQKSTTQKKSSTTKKTGSKSKK